METQREVETQIRRRFTAHDYHRMAEAGILYEDNRVELIGEVTSWTSTKELSSATPNHPQTATVSSGAPCRASRWSLLRCLASLLRWTPCWPDLSSLPDAQTTRRPMKTLLTTVC